MSDYVPFFVVPEPSDIEPDHTRKCSVCGASPVIPISGMCGSCTFGEPDSEPRHDPDAPSVNEQAQRSYYDKYYGS